MATPIPLDGATRRKGIARRLTQILGSFVVEGVALFVSAGTMAWRAAWTFLGAQFVLLLALGVPLMWRDPDLVAERGRPGGSSAKASVARWDRPISLVVSVFGPLGIWIVAGLSQRWGWSQLALAWQLIGLGVMAAGYALFMWAMASNRFFSGLVRIQTERGHAVSNGGPYRIVRHPGYVGMAAMMTGEALLLGSAWALAPAAITIGVLVVRTALEDRYLRAQLDGYTEYAERVRWRLLPRIW